MITFKRVDHINISVPRERLEEAFEFYSEVLGLEQIERPDKIFGSKGYWFDIGDVQLHISCEKPLPRSTRHTAFEVTDIDAARKQLAEEGYDPVYGARPLKRVIQQRLQNELANAILGGEFAEGAKITIDVQNGDFTFGGTNEDSATASSR